MNRKEQKASTRIRVLLAAQECFRDRDVREVSMQDVATRAGTSVGALYLHYQNRDALIDAIVAELQGQLIHTLKEALAMTEDTTVSNAIRRLASVYISSLGDLRSFMSLYANHMTRVMSIDTLRSGGGVAPLQQMVSATFASLTALVSFRVDVPTLASSLVSVWRGAAIACFSRPLQDEETVAESLAAMTEVLLAGVCPGLLEFDARKLAHAMAQHLKEPTLLTKRDNPD